MAITATLAKTEGSDTASSAGTTSITATFAKTEGTDTSDALGGERFTFAAGTGNSGNVQPSAIKIKIIYAGV